VLHALFMGLLDELLAAFHLAQRAFASQAYAHVRTVEEVLEAIDMLSSEKTLLEQWLNATAPDDERAVFKTLRQRIGQLPARSDGKKLYSFLSALGPHSQFRALQARTKLQHEDGERTATVFFCGSPTQLEAANVLTVRAAVATARHIADAFATVLHKSDVEQELDKCRTGLTSLVTAHLASIASQMRLPAQEILQILAHRVGRP
jgi:hypothetical protein